MEKAASMADFGALLRSLSLIKFHFLTAVMVNSMYLQDRMNGLNKTDQGCFDRPNVNPVNIK